MAEIQKVTKIMRHGIILSRILKKTENIRKEKDHDRHEKFRSC